MKSNIFSAIKLTLVCLIFFMVIYPLILFGIAQLSPNNGKGNIIEQDGKTYYSNIGQTFTEDKYFYSRPSAVAYNAAGSGGSNKGPSNPQYLEEVKQELIPFWCIIPALRNQKSHQIWLQRVEADWIPTYR